MATHSVGVTKKIHRRLQNIKKKYNVTMGGFATFALRSTLANRKEIKKIIDEIEANGARALGAGRLQKERGL